MQRVRHAESNLDVPRGLQSACSLLPTLFNAGCLDSMRVIFMVVVSLRCVIDDSVTDTSSPDPLYAGEVRRVASEHESMRTLTHAVWCGPLPAVVARVALLPPSSLIRLTPHGCRTGVCPACKRCAASCSRCMRWQYPSSFGSASTKRRCCSCPSAQTRCSGYTRWRCSRSTTSARAALTSRWVGGVGGSAFSP
jgi:hypothetical protein